MFPAATVNHNPVFDNHHLVDGKCDSKMASTQMSGYAKSLICPASMYSKAIRSSSRGNCPPLQHLFLMGDSSNKVRITSRTLDMSTEANFHVGIGIGIDFPS